MSNNSQNIHTGLSASLLLGLLTKPVFPKPLVQVAINQLTKKFQQMHGGVISRMNEFAPARIILNPVDMPFVFFVEFQKDNFSILLLDEDSYVGEDITTISATFAFFLNMLEGDKDGDALFFSRQLTLTGDTTVIVALRNILEAESININKDINAQFGFFAPMVFFVKNLVTSLFTRVDSDINKVTDSVVGQLKSELVFQKKKQLHLQQELHALQKKQEAINNKIKSMRINKSNNSGVE